MKTILCIFLLNITAVSVFGQSVELNGILGESVKFTAAVKKAGSLMYGTLIIGDVTSGIFRTSRNERFNGRVQWDSSTGLFSLSGLKMEDSGEYEVQNTDQNINTVFQLKVYKDNVNVSKPHVSVTGDEYPCTLLCAVERGTEATLSWYREGEKKSLVSSHVESASHLHLSVPVERSGTYTCEAKNSVSRETSDPLTVGAHCTAVFGQSVELNRIVGQRVEFPAAVKKGGFLMYSGVTIRDSSRGASRNENYRDRLQWDSSTGFFSLSGLKMEDSGEYKVQNTDQNINVFQLNVYKENVPVSKPHVSITQNEYPCTIECTAERGTGVTLSWYREGQKKSLVSSREASAPHLHLPETVERGGTYTCEAKNSVSNETASITVGDHCTAPADPIMWILIAVVLLLFLAIVTYFLWRRFKRRRRAVRTLIQVKKLIDNVDLHGYDEPDPPDAVRTLIQVKKKFDNLDPRACGVETVNQVKMLLANVDVYEYVKMLFDNVDLYKNDETVHPDAIRTLIQVKVLLNDLGLLEYDETVHPDGMFTYHPEATEKTTSSHQTEVPLKQVTCEVGDT